MRIGTAHPETSDPDVWWAALYPQFELAFRSLGIDSGRASELAARVRAEYCDPSMWSLFDDTIPVLRCLSEAGWRHYVLSNHVPELPEIAAALGLDGLLEEVCSSAATGYEKPNRMAFLTMLQRLPADSSVVMIGDNIEADVRGAMALGIPSVLVRKPSRPGLLHSDDLYGIDGILGEIPGVQVSDVLHGTAGSLL